MEEKMASTIETIAGLGYFGCIIAIIFLIISDQGAKITQDGLPLTSGWAYLVLAIAAVIFFVASIIAGEIAEKGEEKEFFPQCP